MQMELIFQKFWFPMQGLRRFNKWDLYFLKAIHNSVFKKLIKEKIISFGLMPSNKVLFN